MIIKSIEVNNFMCFPHQVVEFGPVTSFVGPNSAGKSTISFRVLQLALLGGTWPENWITTGKTSSEIKVLFSNGKQIIRKRTKKSQETIFIDSDGTEKVYRGIKDASHFFPEFTGFSPIEIDTVAGPENLWFIDPDNGLYLVNKRPEQLKRSIENIFGRGVLENASKTIKKEQRNLSGKIKTLKSRIEEEHGYYKDVLIQQNKAEEAKQKSMHIDSLVNTSSKIVKLKELEKKIISHEDLLTKLQEAIELYQLKTSLSKILGYRFVDKSIILLQEVTKLEERLAIYKRLKEVKNQIETLKTQLDNLPEIKLCPTCNKPLP
jgi:DNA repair exonuclease SbcCD ATPase subunit